MKLRDAERYIKLIECLRAQLPLSALSLEQLEQYAAVRLLDIIGNKDPPK